MTQLHHTLYACPGLQCPQAWHDNGCDPFWQYADRDGYVLRGGVHDEDDAMSRTFWTCPDGPDEVWHRRSSGARWVRES